MLNRRQLLATSAAAAALAVAPRAFAATYDLVIKGGRCDRRDLSVHHRTTPDSRVYSRV
jgi:hypothetical protein